MNLFIMQNIPFGIPSAQKKKNLHTPEINQKKYNM